LYHLLCVARDFGADVIHTHLSSGAWLGSLCGRMLNTPVLAHVHALNTKTCFVYADMLAACSRGVREHITAQGIPQDRTRVVYNGIDLAALERLRPLAEVRRDMAISDGRPVVGVAAHLTPKKGQKYLVQAVALLGDRRPDLLCYLLGEGEKLSELSQLAADLGIADRIRFMGYRPDAVDLMQAMDIVILPSVSKEGLGLCLVEASALGKAVIGSDAPGINEVIDSGRTGLLVPPGRADALAEAIDSLLADAALRERMGQAGRKRVADIFTLDKMVAQTEALYYELIQRRGSRGR
jgi:glycosyltransferase involved in cell wall biosynthesis